MSSIKSLPPSSRYKSKISNQKNPETKSFVPPSNLLWMQQNSVCFATASPKPSESSFRHPPPLFSQLPSTSSLKLHRIICRPITRKKIPYHFMKINLMNKLPLLQIPAGRIMTRVTMISKPSAFHPSKRSFAL